MTAHPHSTKKSLAIIGAGASGLVSCRHLLSLFPSITLFEKTNTLSGTWKYRPEGHKYSNHNAMYESLHTNLAHHIMAFMDFPFDRRDLMRDKGMESTQEADSGSLLNFPPHHEVHRYLVDYAKYFQLERFVEYETEVVRMERTKEQQWRIVSRKVDGSGTEDDSNLCQERIYDAVVVANGHYSDPYIPHFPGKGQCENLMHSSSYKTLDWRKKRFVLVGIGPSGGEIARELAEDGANEVFLVARSMDQEPPRVECESGGSLQWITSNIKKSQDKGHTMLFENGFKLENIDHIMLCTGYNYSFPFMEHAEDPESGDPIVQVKDNQVIPLYKHLAHIKYHHSLYFVGLPFKTIPFPLSEFQAIWIKHVLLDKVNLPLENGLLPQDQPQTEKQKRPRYFHDFSGGHQWVYCNDLAKDCGVPGVEPIRRAIYDEIHQVRRMWSDRDFREYNYKTINQCEKEKQ
mmetsp:Transcript_6335/g.23880  ORF Transcript_6335/g.23880 Transcript_6335/m.23880 type:complete len:460 (-) Transcript_6335:180-1559(-)